MCTGLYSRAMFSYLTPLMVVGFKRALQMEDLPPLLPTDTAAHISKAFKRRWHDQVRSDVWGRSFSHLYACECFAIGMYLLHVLFSTR